MTNRATVAAIAAGAIIVGAIVAIVLFGFIPIPDYPTVADEPDPPLPGVIAFSVTPESDNSDEFEERCVHIAEAATGAQTEVLCRDRIGWSVAWTEDGRIVTEDFRSSDDGGPLLVIDAIPDGSVETVRSIDDPHFLWPEQRTERADGARVRTTDGGSRVVIRTATGETTILLQVDDAPSNYRFIDPQWSPDGRFVLVGDSEGRFLVLHADGEVAPRILVETGEEGRDLAAAWYIEGNPTYTVSSDELAGE